MEKPKPKVKPSPPKAQPKVEKPVNFLEVESDVKPAQRVSIEKKEIIQPIQPNTNFIVDEEPQQPIIASPTIKPVVTPPKEYDNPISKLNLIMENMKKQEDDEKKQKEEQTNATHPNSFMNMMNNPMLSMYMTNMMGMNPQMMGMNPQMMYANMGGYNRPAFNPGNIPMQPNYGPMGPPMGNVITPSIRPPQVIEKQIEAKPPENDQFDELYNMASNIYATSAPIKKQPQIESNEMMVMDPQPSKNDYAPTMQPIVSVVKNKTIGGGNSQFDDLFNEVAAPTENKSSVPSPDTQKQKTLEDAFDFLN